MNPVDILAWNNPKSASIHAVKRYPIVGLWWNWYSSKCKASMAWLYTVLNPTKAADGVWWIWYSSKCKASMAWLYTVLNPTKAAGGVWWIWYTWLHALFTGLYCGVLNPSKAAGGVWWIWYTWLHALFTWLYCGVLNPSKSGKIRRRILDHGGFGVVMFLFNVAFMSGVIATLATLDNGPLN